jgi:hypothetical protein
MGSISKMISAAKTIDKANEGYDQLQRWTFFDRDTDKLKKGKECDCSSLCGAIIRLGGYPINLKGTCYTGNFASLCKAAGGHVYAWPGLDKTKAGGFALRDGHVEFITVGGKNGEMFSAHIDERGKASGGKAGNQTGKEVGYRKAYETSGKPWKFYIEFDDDAPKETPKKDEPKKETPKAAVYGKPKGYKGVSIVDALKAAGVASDFGTRMKIAKANGIGSYSGTAYQNAQLLELLMEGKLIKI